MIDKDTIIKLARSVGGTPYTNRHYPGETAVAFGPQALQDFAKAVYRHGLEDAAKVAESYIAPSIGKETAAAIRALKELT